MIVLGDEMKIYLDLIFFLNFSFDFLLLLSVSVMLKRNTKIKRLILGSLVGSISIFVLFIDMGNFGLFCFKIFISLLMIVATFNYNNLKAFITNLAYLYFTSIVLGGFLYFLNLEFSYKNEGMIFYNNGLSINALILIVLSPLALYFYVKQNKVINHRLKHIYTIDMYYKNCVYKYRGYLDTGNKLYDQYKKRPIVLLYDKKIDTKIKDGEYIMVPYKTLNNTSLLRCIKIDKLVLDNKKIISNVLIGLSNEKFYIDEVDMILHNDLIKGEEQ